MSTAQVNAQLLSGAGHVFLPQQCIEIYQQIEIDTRQIHELNGHPLAIGNTYYDKSQPFRHEPGQTIAQSWHKKTRRKRSLAGHNRQNFQSFRCIMSINYRHHRRPILI